MENLFVDNGKVCIGDFGIVLLEEDLKNDKFDKISENTPQR